MVGPGIPEPRQAEVDQPWLARRVNQDVRRLDVEVDDAAETVRHGQGSSDPSHDGGGAAGAGTVRLGVLLEVGTGYVIHHQVGPAVVDVEVVDSHQAGMIQLGQGPFLADQLVAAGSKRPPPRA